MTMNDLKLCDSYSRLPALLSMACEIDRGEWLTLLGREWSCIDNISEHLGALIEHLPQTGPVFEMMDAAEAKAWHALPGTVTVWRGAGKINKRGMSWSLDRTIAARFPFLARYRQQCPMLYRAEVDKKHVLAIKLDREEAEIITLPWAVRIVESKRLARPD